MTRGRNLELLVSKLVFDYESEGDLYRDLNDLTLGLGIDLGEDVEIEWDNSFLHHLETT